MTPKKKFRLLRISTIILCVLLFLLMLPGWINWKWAKPGLDQNLSAALGRSVQIDGAIHFQLLPYPGIRATHARVHRQADPNSPLFMELGSLDLQAAWLPLLTGVIQIDTLNLGKPNIDMDIVRLPALNVNLPPGTETDNAVPDDNWFTTIIVPDWLSAFQNKVEIKKLVVEDGTIRVTSRNKKGGFQMQQVNLRAKAQSLIGPISLSANFNLDGKNYTMDAILGVPTDNGLVPFEVKGDETETNVRYHASGALEGLFAESENIKPRFAVRGQVNRDLPGIIGARLPFSLDSRRISWPDFPHPDAPANVTVTN